MSTYRISKDTRTEKPITSHIETVSAFSFVTCFTGVEGLETKVAATSTLFTLLALIRHTLLPITSSGGHSSIEVYHSHP
jgi:hypothetical protein